MAAFTAAIALAGLALSGVGAAVQYSGQQKSLKAQKQAEDLRKKQMELDAARQRREIARKAMISRADALSNATNQGASQGSGLQGGFAQIANEAGRSTVAVNQNEQIGKGIFDANMRDFQGRSQAATGGAIGDVGGMFLNNSDLLGRVGTYFTGWGAK